MRKKIVAGNWKMNNDQRETAELTAALKASDFQQNPGYDSPLFLPNFQQAVALTEGTRLEVLAQNMNAATNGAFTGEISAPMLNSIGIQNVILGHSERRAYYNETDDSLKSKVDTALLHDMEVVFCFGEELNEKEISKPL